jgi:methylmalonyl-CoA carboxyltransferase 5S subunit
MALEDLVPACEDIDQAGYWSVECWGGATYDACIRFLNEDPWERLRTFRKLMPNSRLQMLLRGQNLLGYRHYEDSVVDRFVDKSAENGMDVFRVFDALNDIRNLRRALEAVRRTGKHTEGTICYTISPLHTVERFVEMASSSASWAATRSHQDMAALLKPQPAQDRGIKRPGGATNRPRHVRHHRRHDGQPMKAIEAGAASWTPSISSLSPAPPQPDGALVSRPATARRRMAFKIKEHFARVRPRYAEFESRFIGVETEIFDSQIPGGMISNMESQLKQQGAGQRVKEVLAEVPHVRKDAGYPPLVTPSSQIVGTQAVFNVLMGRYKVLTGEFADLMLGYYGATLGARDPAVLEAAAKHAKKEPITGRPADLLKPEWDELRAQALALKGCNGSDEDVLTYAMFPQVAGSSRERAEGPKNLGRSPPTRDGAAGAGPTAKRAEGLSWFVTYQVKLAITSYGGSSGQPCRFCKTTTTLKTGQRKER